MENNNLDLGVNKSGFAHTLAVAVSSLCTPRYAIKYLYRRTLSPRLHSVVRALSTTYHSDTRSTTARTPCSHHKV